MTKSEKKQKLQISTRRPKPKGDMFANLRTREQIETVPFEDFVTPVSTSNSTNLSHPNPPQPTPTHPNSAPSRDFNRRANSLERDALPAGLFPGTSKKLYDALYLRTRGAITPVRIIQATKRELMAWSGIRSKNTIAINLKILSLVGLIRPDYDPGNHEGSIYEVLLPEELLTQPVLTHPNPSQPIPTQKLGLDPTQKLGWDGLGKLVDSQGTYEFPKTSFKTSTEKTDDEADATTTLALALEKLIEGITGKEATQAELEKFAEVIEILALEGKIASARTTVSSAGPFLAEHLRRRLFKKDKLQLAVESAESEPAATTPAVDATACPDCAGVGWYYPEGKEKGMAKCKHTRLSEQAGG